jgi:hypothetical protein
VTGRCEPHDGRSAILVVVSTRLADPPRGGQSCRPFASPLSGRGRCRERAFTPGTIASPLASAHLDMGCNISTPMPGTGGQRRQDDGSKTASRAAPVRSDTRCCKEVLSSGALEVRAAPATGPGSLTALPRSVAARGATPARRARAHALPSFGASHRTWGDDMACCRRSKRVLTCLMHHTPVTFLRLAVLGPGPADS